MKKMLSFCLAILIFATMITIPMPASAKEEMNVVFLGGSITEANSGYASQVGRWIKNYYPDKEVNIYNAGLGGTPSSVGLMRLGKDVLSYSPDLVFVEFAVNDTPYTSTEVKEYMDGIVWTLQNQEKVPAVVFIYTTKREGNSFTDAANIHQQVAAYYKIPSIDVGEALVEEVENGTDWTTLLSDGVHPTVAGHKLYAKTITDAISENPDYYLKPMTPKTNPSVGSNKELVYPTMLDIHSSRITRSSGWGEGEHSGSAMTVCNTWNALNTNKKGETLELEFYGTRFGLMYLMNENFGEVTYSIDGSSPKTMSCQYGISYYQPVGALLEKGLSEGKHTVKITTADTKGVKLLGILLDEGENVSVEDSIEVIQSVKTIGGAKLNAEPISADTKGFMVRFGYPVNAASVNNGISVTANGAPVPVSVTVSGQTAKVTLLEKLPENGRGIITLNGIKTLKGQEASLTVHFETKRTTSPRFLDAQGEYGNLPAGRTLAVNVKTEGEYDAILCTLIGEDGKADVTAYRSDEGSVQITTPQNTDGLTLKAYILKDGKISPASVRSVRISE